MIGFAASLAMRVALDQTGGGLIAPHGRDQPVQWVLRRLGSRRIGPSEPEAATLSFGSDHLVGGTATCDSFIGRRIGWFYRRSPLHGWFRYRADEAMPWSLVDCRDKAQSRIGGEFWNKMRAARTWSLTASTLEITFADGSTASFDRAKG